jgi:hypothetical protein
MARSAGVVHGRCEPVGVNLPAGRHRARLIRADPVMTPPGGAAVQQLFYLSYGRPCAEVVVG